MIRIYGKPNCGLCDAAKRKLDLLGLAYEFHLIGDTDRFRENPEHVDAMACHADLDTLPILSIDGRCMSYPEAMKTLREKK